MKKADEVITLFIDYSAQLDKQLRASSILRQFFEKDFSKTTVLERIAAHAAYHHVTAGYVHWTVPLLQRAGQTLANGDEEDLRWSEAFLLNSKEETDMNGNYGHDRWALDDIKAIGVPPALAHSAPPATVNGNYKTFMVDDAHLHPYGGLGAKGVLEHLAITMADDLRDGLLQSGIPNIEKGVGFLHQHGILDIEHTRSGNERIITITSPRKLEQIAQGACVTKEAYTTFIDAMNESYQFFLSELPKNQ